MGSQDVEFNKLTQDEVDGLFAEDPLTELEESEEEAPPQPIGKEALQKPIVEETTARSTLPMKFLLRGFLVKDKQSISQAEKNKGAGCNLCGFKSDAHSPPLFSCF